MTLDASATGSAVQLRDLSPHGAAVTGGPAAQQGARGGLAIDGVEAGLAFVVRQIEAVGGGFMLHLDFTAGPEAAGVVGRLLQRHGLAVDSVRPVARAA